MKSMILLASLLSSGVALSAPWAATALDSQAAESARAATVRVVETLDARVMRRPEPRAPETRLPERAPETRLPERAPETRLPERAPETRLPERAPDEQPGASGEEHGRKLGHEIGKGHEKGRGKGHAHHAH